MTRLYLGVDTGATKSHALLADETGRVCGFGQAGPGNHELIGYDGLKFVLADIVGQALRSAGASVEEVAGAGFGIAGYDWPSERDATLDAVATLGLRCPYEAVNDALIGLLAGAAEGWGVALIAGTGNNCWGWGAGRHPAAHVTGNGQMFAEYGGAYDLVWKARAAVAAEYTRRGPQTALSKAFMELVDAPSLEDLLDGLSQGSYAVGAEHAPLVFRLADEGDAVAAECIAWMGRELGSLACGVILQLGIEALAFDVVLVGSLYNGGDRLIEPLRETIRSFAPAARLVRLAAPPVVGAVVLAMDVAGLDGSALRAALADSARAYLAPLSGG